MKTKTLKTFNQWSDAGYLIKKGEKGKNVDGQWMFSGSQVRPKPPRPEHYDGGWNNADDLNTCGGPMYGLYGNCD